MTNQSFSERLDIDKKNYPIVSRLTREAIKEGVIVEYEKSKMDIRHNRNIRGINQILN